MSHALGEVVVGPVTVVKLKWVNRIPYEALKPWRDHNDICGLKQFNGLVDHCLQVPRIGLQLCNPLFHPLSVIRQKLGLVEDTCNLFGLRVWDLNLNLNFIDYL